MGYQQGQQVDFFSTDLGLLRLDAQSVTALIQIGERLENWQCVPADCSQGRAAFDLPERHQYGVSVELGDWQTLGLVERTRMGVLVELEEWRRPYRIPGLDFESEWIEWRDPLTGFVWESAVHLHPLSPTVHYKITRPWLGVGLKS
jgi:hypothetical protein